MAFPRVETVTVITDGSGAATEYTSRIRGHLMHIRYTKTDFANGSTFLITGETTKQIIWSESSVNATAERSPTYAAHTVTGGAVTNGYVLLTLPNERIKISITSGGSTHTGTFRFIWE
jgi:hypothetical protein